MATITTSVGFKVILRRTERLRWATWAAMGGLAREHIGHRARSPFGHRDGVPPVCPPASGVFGCGSAHSSRRQPSVGQFQSSMPAIGPRPQAGDDDPPICNEVHQLPPTLLVLALHGRLTPLLTH